MPEKDCAERACCPELIDDCRGPDEIPGRTFPCARCNVRVFICSHCDRGQIYCAGGCGPTARRAAQLEAGRRYQQSRNGRFAHAERNRRYRVRHKNVTHQGSPLRPSDGLVTTDPSVIASEPLPPSRGRECSIPSSGEPWRCHFCGRICPQFVRQGFLRRRRVPRRHSRHSRRGTDHRGYPS